ncbi:methyltransferase domain-containing protein [Candidatus Woesearchaeota archaeon]|nr:methyltransferase domain-containing protein [Candidatus Woesearchaeota archaeon]
MEPTQYQYFEQRGILSQHRNLQTQQEFDSYEKERRNLFTDKLCLHPNAFRNSELLEIGPSAGENALVFAKWGAKCTLIEPNKAAHPHIRNYFEKFGLSEKLAELGSETIEEYSKLPAYAKYDYAVAEGFIYLVKPDSLWMEFFSKALKENGLLILNYCESYGNFQELMLKAIHARVKKLTGLSSEEAAKKWLHGKWNSIPHTTTLHSWTADVLDNPTVRLSRFYELKKFNAQMHRAGFILYASWPPYKDSSIIYWAKKKLKAEEQLNLENEFIEKSALSYMFGKKLLLKQPDEQLENAAKELITLIDSLIDGFNEESAKKCGQLLSQIETALSSERVLAKQEDKETSVKSAESIRTILKLLAAGNANDIIEFCNKDEPFIKSWGMPTHHAIYMKAL